MPTPVFAFCVDAPDDLDPCGKTGEDAAGDAIVLVLFEGGVGTRRASSRCRQPSPPRRLIVVVASGQAAPERLADDAVVFEAPASDQDDDFASLVGSFAAALDGGDEPGEAFRSLIEANGWDAPTSG